VTERQTERQTDRQKLH